MKTCSSSSRQVVGKTREAASRSLKAVLLHACVNALSIVKSRLNREAFCPSLLFQQTLSLLQAPDDNLTLHAENHTASFPHNSYLDKIIEGAHRRQYSSPYEMMVDVDKMLEYAQQRIASIDSADRQIGRFSCVPVDMSHTC